jgi:hypothetical protein
MADVSRQQFTEAVHAALGSLWHLYREVDRLNTALRDTLQREPLRFHSVGGTSSGKGSSDEDRLVVRNWYGRLYGVEGSDGADDADEDAEPEEESDEGLEEGRPRRRRRPVRIPQDTPLLAVKVVLFDPTSAAPVEPELQYVVIGDWALGTGGAKLPARGAFELEKLMLRRLLKAIPATTPPDAGRRILTRAKVRKAKGMKGVKGKGDRRLGFRCLGDVVAIPLFKCDSAAALDQLVDDVKAYWRKVVIGNGSRR